MPVSIPINNIISALQDGSPARIKLSFKDGFQQHFDCRFQEDTGNAPYFFLVFSDDNLPHQIDFDKEHPVSVIQEEKTVSLNVSVIERIDTKTLHLVAKSTLNPASLRKYFRVNTTTEITASYTTTLQSGSKSSWSLDGQTMDLSASGVLCLFSDEPKNNAHIILEIYLPHDNLTVNAVSHIVHKKRLRNRRWLVAFHFDTVSTKHKDAIITYLLSEQRKQLRENIRTQDF